MDILYDLCLMPIPFFVGIIFSYVKRKMFDKKYKTLLKLGTEDGEIGFFTANTGKYDATEHVQLGYVFEYMAVGTMLDFFNNMYKNFNYMIQMSDLNYYEIRTKYLRKNLVLIGGPFHNSVTKNLIFSNVVFPFSYDDDATLIYTSPTGEKEYYHPEISHGTEQYFEKDYALIINVKNPLDNGKRIIALIGCRSVGCYGASVFLCNDFVSIRKYIVDDEYALVIECYGEEENITSKPKFVKYYGLNKKDTGEKA